MMSRPGTGMSEPLCAVQISASVCGAGCYTAFSALELYAEAFGAAGALDRLEAFASFNGPAFYGLPRNTGTVTLDKGGQTVGGLVLADSGSGGYTIGRNGGPKRCGSCCTRCGSCGRSSTSDRNPGIALAPRR